MPVARLFQVWLQKSSARSMLLEVALFCMNRTKGKTQGYSIQCVHGKQSHSGLSGIGRSSYL